MNRKQPDRWELLKRAAALNNGISPADFRRFRILFARRGNAPREYFALESSIFFREFKESLQLQPFTTPRPMRGDIILGKHPGGTSRYESKFAPSHLLGIGATGSGKTVMLTFLLLQYLVIASGIWVFDFIKRELRGIRRLAQRMQIPFEVCRYEYLRINLLDPQGTNPSLYANVCAEFFTLMLSMPPVAKLILKICITDLYRQGGILLDPNASPPLMSELIRQVRSFEGNKAAKEAILIRLEGFLANQESIFNVRKGLPVSELAQRFIIWEFDGTETTHQNLVVSYLISMLFLQRVQFRSNQLMIVALDEASRLYSQKIESTYDGPSFISTATATVRKMMIALLVFTQTTHDLSNSIISNSGIKALFRVGSARDYEAFGRSMGLTATQIQWVKTNLEIGQQIIKMGFGWQVPFLNRTPNIQLPEDVSDREVTLSSQAIMNLIRQPPSVSIPLLTPTTTVSPEDPLESLTPSEKALYQEIRQNPLEPNATAHYRAAGLNTRQGGRAKKSLVEKGLCRETLVEKGKRGGAKSFLEIVDTGKSGRRGGSLHNYLRNIAQSWYQSQGLSTQMEMPHRLDDQTVYVDLAVFTSDGTTEALEIETEDSPRALGNVQKNLVLGFTRVSVLTPNKKVRESVRKRIFSGIPLPEHDRIHFRSIGFYEQ